MPRVFFPLGWNGIFALIQTCRTYKYGNAIAICHKSTLFLFISFFVRFLFFIKKELAWEYFLVNLELGGNVLRIMKSAIMSMTVAELYHVYTVKNPTYSEFKFSNPKQVC